MSDGNATEVLWDNGVWRLWRQPNGNLWLSNTRTSEWETRRVELRVVPDGNVVQIAMDDPARVPWYVEQALRRFLVPVVPR